jgi:putative transport protein
LDPLIVLLCVIGIGLFLGRLSCWGISFGTSAILFVALAAGHLGYKVPEGFGTLGMAFFVYCVGISAGPTFFRGLASQGRVMAILGGMIVVIGVAVAWIVAKLLDLPAELAGGLMAGAMTSTPALGAISEIVSNQTSVAVGFGVAYPFGVVAVVLFVQLACKFLPRSEASGEVDDVTSSSISAIQRRVIEIANPGVIGRSPGEMEVLFDSGCQISRVRVEQRWKPLPPDYRFAMGSQLLVIGNDKETRRVAETLGVICENVSAVLDADHERKTVVVTSSEVYGRTLKELRLRSQYGVTVARIRRHEMEFVPAGHTRIEFGDNLVLVGEPADLKKIDSVVGHRPRVMNETDLMSLVAGIGLGILVGNISLSIGEVSVSLGLAGGPLMVGLLLGHFRRIGPIRGAFPPAAQLLMTEGGLALFLTDAGINAGAGMGEILADHGVTLCFAAIAIAVIPMLLGFVIARYWFRLSFYQSLGATCGGMTSTPGLAVLTSSTESSQPVTSYVAAYPIALVLVTILAKILVELLVAGTP